MYEIKYGYFGRTFLNRAWKATNHQPAFICIHQDKVYNLAVLMVVLQQILNPIQIEKENRNNVLTIAIKIIQPSYTFNILYF